MTSNILLRAATEEDGQIFFEQQLDPDANHMAAFTRKNPADQEAYRAHWTKVLSNDQNINRTILFEGQVAGSVSIYRDEDEHLEVTYWLGKPFWGKGIATAALGALLTEVQTRPLYARAAKDNHASLRVLEKCGFAIIGEDKGFANARGAEIEEYLLHLV
jgi:RimJ/RimL family protein N-acetyltransferase